MPSLKEAWEWIDRAEHAREVAGQLTDPGARKAVLELAESFDRLARAAATREDGRRDVTQIRKLGHAVRVLHPRQVALGAASCSTRPGLWILPVGVRGSWAAVRKASRAGTL